MSIKLLTLCVVAAAGASFGQSSNVASLVTVTQAGEIRPEGAVGSISNLAYAAGAASALDVKADTLAETQSILTNRLEGVIGMFAAREGIGYVRGHLMEFAGAGIDPSSVTSTIVKLELGANDGTNQLVNTWTWYNIDPGYAPGFKLGSTPGQTNAWDNATIVYSGTTNITIGSTVYETWHVSVAIPAAMSNVMLQAFAEVGGSGTNDAVLSVDGGISPGGLPPLTQDFYDAESNVVLRLVGGIAVEID